MSSLITGEKIPQSALAQASLGEGRKSSGAEVRDLLAVVEAAPGHIDGGDSQVTLGHTG